MNHTAVINKTEQVTHHLDTILGYEDDNALVEIRFRRPGGAMRQRFHTAGRRDAVANTIVALGDTYDVYVGCAPRTHRHGGRSAIANAWALWADCDSPDAHEAIEAFAIEPTLLIASGSAGARHAYYALVDAVDPDVAEDANRRLAAAIGGDPACTDAARILRPPGTRNHKHQPASTVEILHYNAHYFTLAEILEALPNVDGAQRPREATPRVTDDRDPLRAVAPTIYVEALTGQRPNRDGKIVCPFHEDKTPSLHVYDTPERGWYAYCCGRGGSIYDLAGALWGIEPRGAGFHGLRKRLEETIRGSQVV